MPPGKPIAHATPSPNSRPRPTARATICSIPTGPYGVRPMAAEPRPTAMRRWDRTAPPRARLALSPARITGFRLRRWRASHWPAAAPISASAASAPGARICSRPVPSCATLSGRLTCLAALAYGWQAVTTDRTVTAGGVEQLHAQFNANAWSGRIEGGYRYVTPWMGVTPYAAGQFIALSLPAYAEQALVGAGAFALNYAAKDVTAVRTELGVRLDRSFALQTAILTLRGRAAWAHDYNTDRNIAAVFQTLPGASFVVNGAAQAHDSALTTVSAEVKWLNGWSAAATFEGEFSSVTQSYAGKGVVRYAW